MKRIFALILSVVMLSALFCLPAFGAESDMTFSFELSIDGRQEKTVQTGDVITVVFRLKRTDADEKYKMYGMQNEIRFDSSFFELVEGNEIVTSGIRTKLLNLRDQHKEFYMNYVSMSGGSNWQADYLVGSFQLRVIAKSGVSVITNEDYKVSRPDGSKYEGSANQLTIRLSDDCVIVFFDGTKYSEAPGSDEGRIVARLTGKYGGKLERPENPVREGYYFAGWYKDIEYKEKWNFDTDIVDENTVLYAKWSKNEAEYDAYTPPPAKSSDGYPWGWLIIVLGILLIVFIILILLIIFTKKIVFNSNGGSSVKNARVFKGKKLSRPADPVKEGFTLVGWTKDETGLDMWNFAEDKVEESMTLYAKWSPAE